MAFTESTPVTKPNDYLNRLELDGEDGSEFIDHWDTGELLFLASSVLRSDRNWVSVARSIKPFGEQTRPADWYTPKNCALQYTKLLSEIDEDSKKKTLPRTERETSEVMLVKNLTDKRLTELAWLNQQTKVSSNVLKTYLEMVESGDLDEHLDDLLKQIEDQDKTEEDNYSEYSGRRENLNAAKKLNKSRITKGKTVSKVMDTKKKFPDILDDTSRQMAISELTIKKEVVTDEDFPKTVLIKAETEAPITLNALLDTKVTTASDSPLLTSLLRSIASTTTTPTSLAIGVPSKEGDEIGEHSRLEVDLRSRDASPRSSVPPSPRTPSSSPMLNSLLKNSPSSTTAIQLSPSKDISPKVVSSPQPFFNPTSVLASAAAQQLAAATSSLPQFLQQDQSSESRKFGTSPNTSACLSAPTLSKLLEMPPSTPGRLPPLPVLDPPMATPPTISEPLSDLAESSNRPRSKPSSEPPFPDSSTLQKSSASYSKAASGIHVPSELKPLDSTATVFKFKGDLSRISQENIDLIEAVAESIEQVFEVKDIKQEVVEEESVQVSIPDIMLESTTIPLEGIRPEDCIIDIQSLDSSTIEEVLSSMENAKQEAKIESISSNSVAVKLLDSAEMDKSLSGRKFYKSRNSSKKEENVECSPTKEVSQIKVEPESPTSLSGSKNMTALVVETSVETVQDSKPGRTSDAKSPVPKKPRLPERNSVEKTELSEDENPATIRRSVRRGIKGQASKSSSPSKQLDPKDQYEFTESTEENSVGYQISNTLCYMPRSKEEDSKKEAEEMTSNTSLPSEKKAVTPVRGKQGKPVVSQTTTARKSLFPSDEERMSEMSDESTLSEEKLKRWEEVCEKKKDVAKSANESLKRTSKPIDSPKKKPLPLKRTSSGRRKEQKLSSTDMEDLSVGSRDSEDISSQNKDTSEEKDPVPSTPVDMEMDTNDSQPSSSAAAESDKQLDDAEESSVSSPPAVPSNNKEEKESAQWFQGVSPKSSEAVSQSSEESEEYESDNWDNQSVSTNKSAAHAASTQPRLTRKERESPQYKAWKKAISIVLREATCHKNANIFLQKVTNDVAPGYLSVVHKPMDLSLIKKNIDNGVIRTTEEFQRDMLLMFQNAIMYNSSDHDVYKMAVEMQRDVVAQISAFIGTQSSEKDEATEPVSSLRGGRKSLKGHAKHGTKAEKEE